MKLLLADDHTLFRDALVQYIERAEPDALVTVADSFTAAMEVMQKNPDQDLILLDLRMPGMNGMEGFKIVREKYPDIPVALMSGIAEKEDVNAAMELGAVGYFPKTLSGKALLTAVQLVLAGEKFMPLDYGTNGIMPSYHDDGQGKLRGRGVPSNDDDNISGFGLTPRETEVLSYLVQGASNKEIANALGLQVVTVKLHVRGVCRKLDAKNRTQAALKAKEVGFAS